MDREQISWLIVRAFGLYFAIQAVLLVPELASSIYATRAFNSLMSSMSSDNSNLASTARQASTMYRNLWLAPLVRFVLFALTGVYLLRGGGFLVRWLQRVPEAPRNDTKPGLTQEDASGMTVNERLSAAGLFEQFDNAVERRDVRELERILRQIYLAPDSIQAVIEQVLGPR